MRMMMQVYLPLAAVLLVIPTLLTIYWSRLERYSGANLTVIACLVVLSITALRIPLNLAQGEGGLTAFLHGLVSSLQTIGLGTEIPDVVNEGVCLIDGISEARLAELTLSGVSRSARLYAGFAVLQYAAAIVLCGFALIKTVSRLLLRWQLKLCLRPVFFFSELSEESISLACSIQQSMRTRHRRALFCFTGVKEEMDADLAQVWREARLSHAFQLRETLNARLFPWFAARVNCIFCSEDEERNMKALTALLQENSRARAVRRRVMKYFIYAQSTRAEHAVDALTAKYIPGGARSRNQIICLLNHMENLAVHILDEAPLHEYAAANDRGERRLNILVAGSTPLAVRFLRNAYPCGQMENCTLNITLADPRAEEVRQRLYAAAPMLQCHDLPILQACGGLHFRPLCAPGDAADDALLRDVQYVLVDEGSDDENVKLARQIRRVIERQRLTDPDRARQEVAIVYVVKDAAMNALCREIDPAEGFGGAKACRMIPVGAMTHQHHAENLLGDELLIRAFLLDRVYNARGAVKKTADGLRELQGEFVAFMNKAYERRSTVATALHLKYSETVLRDGHLSEEEKLQALAHTEHMRWAAYIIMAGYQLPTARQLEGYYFTGEATHRSKLLKLHPCLVPCKKERTQNLWADGATPMDALDVLSIRLHHMALQRLSAYLPAKMLAHPAPRDKAGILRAAESLTDAQAREQAVRLARTLFRDFKQYDLDLVASTADVLRDAGDPEIQAALRLFWLEEDR